MAPLKGNALVGQSGGPTCVINQSLVGIIQEAAGHDAIERVFGARHGIKGVLGEDFIDLSRESHETLERVAVTPCAALRSVRKKPTRDECEQALGVFKKHNIRYFFYIGGNDSAETAHILNEVAVAENYDVRLFHVPKTIDNDLRVTDHCPGYGSAAKFVASAFMGDNQDNRSLPGIKIDVVMGRHAGWLTAASLLAREHEDDGPHLIYVPEVDFSIDSFLGDVDRMYKRHGRCLIAVSEGVHGPGGEPIITTGEVDSHGNVQLSGTGALGDFLAAKVKAGLGEGLRVRADTFGYLQRSFAGYYSEVDAREAREVGRTAVRVAVGDSTPHGSVFMAREAGADYQIRFDVTELKNVAKETRDLDAGFLKGTCDIDASFLDYVRPLVGNMPSAARLSDFAI
jgi:ATP-dependent phosphofructokinase / diphosphate-dependent phosphofructokinase